MERKKIIKTGIFVLLVIILFVWGYRFISSKKIFTTDRIFYGSYENVSGLMISNSIFLNGMKVGMVRDIYFEYPGAKNLIVEFSIEKDILVPKKSIAEIISYDLMGTKAVNLVRNFETKEYYNDGDTMITGTEIDIKEQINQQILPLKTKTENLISSFDSVLISLQAIFNDNTKHNLRKSFDHIEITLLNLSNASYTLDNLMTTEKVKLKAILSNAESITTNINNNNEQITNILQNFSAVSDSVAKSDIVSVINEAGLVLTQMNEITSKINSGSGTIGLLINNDDLYNKLDITSKHLDELLIDIKENPKRYLKFSAF